MPKGVYRNHVKGENHYRFNNGKMLSSHGYIKLRLGKDNPLSDGNGYAYEHLVVWVNSGRPRPGKGFAIHHINENKQDNRIENLELVSVHEHAVKHHSMLSDKDVCDIRIAYASGAYNMTELAARYNVPVQRVHRFITGSDRLKAGGPVSKCNRVGKKRAGNLLDGVRYEMRPGDSWK